MKNKNLRTQKGGSDAGVIGGTCGCYIAVIIFNLALGAWSLNYCLQSFIGHTIDTWIAVLVGLFVAEITFPVAIICVILNACGVHTPYLH